MWSEEKLSKMGELASKLNNEELRSQAEKCLSEYKEVEDMLIRRQETLQRAAVRVQVSDTRILENPFLGSMSLCVLCGIRESP